MTTHMANNCNIEQLFRQILLTPMVPMEAPLSASLNFRTWTPVPTDAKVQVPRAKSKEHKTLAHVINQGIKKIYRAKNSKNPTILPSALVGLFTQSGLGGNDEATAELVLQLPSVQQFINPGSQVSSGVSEPSGPRDSGDKAPLNTTNPSDTNLLPLNNETTQSIEKPLCNTTDSANSILLPLISETLSRFERGITRLLATKRVQDCSEHFARKY